MSQKTRQKPPTEEPTSAPFIDPLIAEIAHGYTSGRIPADEPIETPAEPLPPDLRPFMESLSLPVLCTILERRPGLYWHPIVASQLIYLRRISWDQGEWNRLGWELEERDAGEFYPPQEAGIAHTHLEKLTEAHARGLFPGRRIKWLRVPQKPGRKLGFHNPHPTGERPDSLIQVAIVDWEEQKLRLGFRRRLEDLRRREKESRDAFRARVEEMVREVLDTSDAGQWSGLTEFVRQEHTHADESPGLQVADTRIRICLACIPERRWTKPLHLDDSVLRALLTGRLGAAGKEGRAAFLAYVVLGKLLGKPATVIRSRLLRVRGSRKRARKRTL